MKRPRKRVGSTQKRRKTKGPSSSDDPFFAAADNANDDKNDEEVLSSDDDVDGNDERRGRKQVGEEEDDEEEGGDGNDSDDAETADERRLRMAKAYLDKIRTLTSEKEKEEEDDGDEEEEDGEGVVVRRAKDKLGERDSLVADLLKQEQMEESGKAQRLLASRVIEPSSLQVGRNVGRRHRQSVTSVTLTEDDSRGFSASKDGLIIHWDIETGKSDKYEWPNEASTRSNGNLPKDKEGKKHDSKHVLALAVSSDGRYLASGGLDRKVHLWDIRTRQHIQAFPGHRGAVSCLAFRLGTQQLISGSFDRSIKLWSIEDRLYIDTLFGHQSEVLSVDCLRQERVLSGGRDRTLRIFKVPDETQLVFRGSAASMECCRLITNNEFLSGSDDGSLSLWSTMKKKAVFSVSNAHNSASQNGTVAELSSHDNSEHSNCNGGDLHHSSAVGAGGLAESWVGAVAVCRSSDLAASGAGNGVVRLWAIEEGNKKLRALHDLPVQGFVNSLAFAKSGRFLLAGVGQEPRLGRWGRIPRARNGVVMHDIALA